MFQHISYALPLLCFLGASALTTTIAGLIYTLSGGTDLMKTIFIDIDTKAAAAVGTPAYFILLLMPYAVVPLAATATVSLLRPRLRTAICFSINRPTLIAIIIASFGFCATRLAFSGFDPGVFGCGDRDAKLVTRMSILEGTGYWYFFFAYGVNLMLPVLSYLIWRQSQQKRDLILYATTIVGMVFFVAVTFSKAPLLAFLFLMTAAVLTSRAGISDLVAVCVVCTLTFLAMTMLVNLSSSCDPVVASPPASLAPPPPSIAPSPKSQIEIPAAAPPIVPSISAPKINPDAHLERAHLLRIFGFGATKRAAAGVPFYISTYDDPELQCGLKDGVFQRLGAAPARCALAKTVFKRMWLQFKTIDGYQPQGAVVTSYAELGMGGAVAVMFAIGIAIGLLFVLSMSVSGFAQPVILAAASGFAFYLTQASFIGALIYPHGLIAFATPIIVLVAASMLTDAEEEPA